MIDISLKNILLHFYLMQLSFYDALDMELIRCELVCY